MSPRKGLRHAAGTRGSAARRGLFAGRRRGVLGLTPHSAAKDASPHVRRIPPLFPNARLIAHRAELATFDSLHPMQWAWYVEDGTDGIDPGRLAVTDGDIELGHGVSIIWTPGHIDGNHSLCLNTPDGVWVSSENGISADNWQPGQSRIPGIRAYHRRFRREVVPNANTLEDAIDQYDSMVIEKTLADPSPRDPRWLQILPSSELAPWRRHWPVIPTFHHGGIDYDTSR
ncbi:MULTISPECIES: hypothetical protein [unclassified Streptomyces]|uniref:hypothetical protein n=1 Tax=unclassified Streptomyces TaxID=2593676 RepID=UPI002366BABF|nr:MULTISPECIES: hypothetical protein [unclassified Streptomyces]MDF3139802.1 hypothetical protein [Streptomyces sp. T21Q-yed]WDF42468.1 hypothetical protein PBV52_39575 [Streptomyces sp. T12]